MKASGRQRQRGGFGLGMVFGLLIGLALALGVALYVTKAPIPFVNKVPQRASGQDAAEVERNRNWDPNAPLSGKNPAKPPAATTTPTAPTPTAPLPPVESPAATPPSTATTTPAASAATRSARAAERAASAPGRAASASARAASASARAASAVERRGAANAGAVANVGAPPSPPALSTGAGSDPFSYFVQAGAYGRSEDAEQQRAKLAMLGLEARLTEREQAGRTVYRVRVGPFDRKEAADAAKEKLNDAGIDSALVRVQK